MKEWRKINVNHFCRKINLSRFLKYLTAPLFFLLATVSHNAHTGEKSVAEKAGNITGNIVRPVTYGLFTLESLVDQGINKIEGVAYDFREGYYQVEYDFRKGYQENK